MNGKRARPLLTALGLSTTVQWVVILSLWLLLPLNTVRVTKPGPDGRPWDITYATHSDLPLLMCIIMALLLVLLTMFLWRRNHGIALGLGLSVLPGLLMAAAYMLQDAG